MIIEVFTMLSEKLQPIGHGTCYPFAQVRHFHARSHANFCANRFLAAIALTRAPFASVSAIALIHVKIRARNISRSCTFP